MKQITLREFCLRPASHLKELPITLVAYGKPVASIIPVNSFKVSSEVLKEEDLMPKPHTPAKVLEPLVVGNFNQDLVQFFEGKKYINGKEVK